MEKMTNHKRGDVMNYVSEVFESDNQIYSEAYIKDYLLFRYNMYTKLDMFDPNESSFNDNSFTVSLKGISDNWGYEYEWIITTTMIAGLDPYLMSFDMLRPMVSSVITHKFTDGGDLYTNTANVEDIVGSQHINTIYVGQTFINNFGRHYVFSLSRKETFELYPSREHLMFLSTKSGKEFRTNLHDWNWSVGDVIKPDDLSRIYPSETRLYDAADDIMFDVGDELFFVNRYIYPPDILGTDSRNRKFVVAFYVNGFSFYYDISLAGRKPY